MVSFFRMVWFDDHRKFCRLLATTNLTFHSCGISSFLSRWLIFYFHAIGAYPPLYWKAYSNTPETISLIPILCFDLQLTVEVFLAHSFILILAYCRVGWISDSFLFFLNLLELCFSLFGYFYFVYFHKISVSAPLNYSHKAEVSTLGSYSKK